MKRKGLAVGILLLLIIGINIGSSLAQKTDSTRHVSSIIANTIYVDDNNTEGPWDGSLEHPYQHIQDGVNNASAGDIVFVFSGSYIEKVRVNKSICLLGEHKNTTFINYSGTYLLDYIVLIASKNVTFSQFTISLTNGTCTAVQLSFAINCNISNNIIRSTWAMDLDNSKQNRIFNNEIITINGGISVANLANVSQGNIIQRNRITNKGNPELAYNFGVALWDHAKNNIICENYFYDCTDHAIYSLSSKNNTIEKNVIRGNISKGDVGIGIYGHNPPGHTIRQNDIAGCVNGIATESDYLTISDNILHDNTDGMYLSSGYYLHMTVINNTFINNSYGLDMVGALFSKVEKNTFHGSTYALVLENCYGLKVRFNNFTANTWAVIQAGSLLNLFYRNNFMGNEHYVLSFLSWNAWLLNYWDHPRLLPKMIVGFLPFIQFDWRPALQPN